MDDVVIAGAGPAGAIAGIVLARAGARVRLVDRASFPRDKLCGDTVNPGALAVLERLGLSAVTAGALPVDGMLVTAASGVCVAGRYGDGVQGRALSRAKLDVALVEAAVAAGVRLDDRLTVHGPLFEKGRVAGVLVGAGRGVRRALRAPLVIAADGASSRVARALRLAWHPARPRRWAVGAYFSDVAGLSRLGEMHVRRGRYIGIAPMPAGLANACAVSADPSVIRRAAASLLEVVQEEALLRDRFADARMVSRPMCLGPLAVESSACGVPGCVLAGDAAGFVDPMTGDGLRLAMRGAELAALAVLDDLQHGTDCAHQRLAESRRREFSLKWRFNRALRTLVGSSLGIRAAARGADWVPAWLQHAIRYAGDLQAT
jgi:flavin-dependent dehydrogenase